MRRIGLLTAASFMLVGTVSQAAFPPLPPPEAYARVDDQLLAQHLMLPCKKADIGHGCQRTGGPMIVRDLPCEIPEPGPVPIVRSRPTDECYKMTPPSEMRGVWVDDFEGQMFFPDAITAPVNIEFLDGQNKPLRTNDIWIEVPKSERNRLGIASRSSFAGGRYQITFVGRQTLYRAPSGHLGMFDYSVIVDHILTIKRIN